MPAHANDNTAETNTWFLAQSAAIELSRLIEVDRDYFKVAASLLNLGANLGLMVALELPLTAEEIGHVIEQLSLMMDYAPEELAQLHGLARKGEAVARERECRS